MEPLYLQAALQQRANSPWFIAEDAESACGSPRCSNWDMDDDSIPAVSKQQQPRSAAEAASQQQQASSSTCHAACPAAQQQQQLDQCHACSSQDSYQHQQMGDDFEALDDSILLDGFQNYPGGVEAALADWQAAVSSKAAPADPAHADDEDADDASSSSCCNYSVLPTQLQFRWQQHPQHLQPQFGPSSGWQQLYRDVCALPHYHQQQQQLQQQQQQRLQLKARLAAADITQQKSPLVAFKGDIVGLVLAGVLTPSCDSSDDGWWIVDQPLPTAPLDPMLCN